MSLFVVSRRRIVYQQAGLGASSVVYVPSTDQIQVLKDAAGTAHVAKPAKAAVGGRQGPLLYRVQKGQRVVYGHLPIELRERRERLKVWLAEDLAPLEAEAFFYIFSAQVIIHGVRERTDDGKLAWRTAQLVLPAAPVGSEFKPLETILADFMFANQDQHVCVAVVNDLKLFKSVQQLCGPLGLTPVPFSTLKPQGGLSPLYSHLNFTWLYMLIMMIGGLAVLAVAVFYLLKQQEAARITQEIAGIDAQIQAVQINPRVGHIRQAVAVVAEIDRPMPVSPTALLSAAGEALVPFGEVRNIQFGNMPPERLQQLGIPVREGVIPLDVEVRNATDALLVDQEARAKEMLAATPWVRDIVRYGPVGQDMTLIIVLQAAAPAGAEGGVQ